LQVAEQPFVPQWRMKPEHTWLWLLQVAAQGPLVEQKRSALRHACVFEHEMLH